MSAERFKLLERGCECSDYACWYSCKGQLECACAADARGHESAWGHTNPPEYGHSAVDRVECQVPVLPTSATGPGNPFSSIYIGRYAGLCGCCSVWLLLLDLSLVVVRGAVAQYLMRM